MQDSGSLAVFKVTSRDQGHYKGPSGAFVTYCNISCFFCFYCIATYRCIRLTVPHLLGNSNKVLNTACVRVSSRMVHMKTIDLCPPLRGHMSVFGVFLLSFLFK